MSEKDIDTQETDKTWENESSRDLSPMVRISVKAVSYTHLTLPTK